MKRRTWAIYALLIGAFSCAFIIREKALSDETVAAFSIPVLDSLAKAYTEHKFRRRGPLPSQNRIVLVEIDPVAIETIGRWPWTRDMQARLVENIFASGAKSVGLVLPLDEPQVLLHEELKTYFNREDVKEVLEEKKLYPQLSGLDVDFQLERTLHQHFDDVVIGWNVRKPCQPMHEGGKECPVTEANLVPRLPKGLEKFSIQNAPPDFDSLRTPVPSFMSSTFPMRAFYAAAGHGGFLNESANHSSTPLVSLSGFAVMPSFALALAQRTMGEKMKLKWDSRYGIELASLKNQVVPMGRGGEVRVNHRGPRGQFTVVSAHEFFKEGNDEERGVATLSKRVFVNEAIVLVGLTAPGLANVFQTPFTEKITQLELEATVLDNLLSGYFLRSATYSELIAIAVFMILAGLITCLLGTRWGVGAVVGWGMLLVSLVYAFDRAQFSQGKDFNFTPFYLETLILTLCFAAWQYMQGLRKEAAWVASAYGFLSPPAAEKLDPSSRVLRPGMKRHTVSMISIEFRGIPEKTDKMESKKLFHLLEDLQNFVENIVFKHNGSIECGDRTRFVAFWGAPMPQPLHAYRAHLAAKEIVEGFKDREYLKKYGVIIHVFGMIHTWPTAIGNFNTRGGVDYRLAGAGRETTVCTQRETGFSKRLLITGSAMEAIEKSGKNVPATQPFAKTKCGELEIDLFEILT